MYSSINVRGNKETQQKNHRRSIKVIHPINSRDILQPNFVDKLAAEMKCESVNLIILIKDERCGKFQQS